jgi:hypothetical protein
MTRSEINRTLIEIGPKVGRVNIGALAQAPEGIPMSQKNRRSNREAKKPKRNKAKVVVSKSPFASANSNAAKTMPGKRK